MGHGSVGDGAIRATGLALKVGLDWSWEGGEPGWGGACADFGGDLRRDGTGVCEGLLDDGGGEGCEEDVVDGGSEGELVSIAVAGFSFRDKRTGSEKKQQVIGRKDCWQRTAQRQRPRGQRERRACTAYCRVEVV